MTLTFYGEPAEIAELIFTLGDCDCEIECDCEKSEEKPDTDEPEIKNSKIKLDSADGQNLIVPRKKLSYKADD